MEGILRGSPNQTDTTFIEEAETEFDDCSNYRDHTPQFPWQSLFQVTTGENVIISWTSDSGRTMRFSSWLENIGPAWGFMGLPNPNPKLEKTFDHVPRSILREGLWEHGLRGLMLKVRVNLQLLYSYIELLTHQRAQYHQFLSWM